MLKITSLTMQLCTFLHKKRLRIFNSSSKQTNRFENKGSDLSGTNLMLCCTIEKASSDDRPIYISCPTNLANKLATTFPISVSLALPKYFFSKLQC